MNAPRNKTALLIVADDPLIAGPLGYFLSRDYTIITPGYKEAHIEVARLPCINRMTRYNHIDTLGHVKRTPVQEHPETPPNP